MRIKNTHRQQLISLFNAAIDDVGSDTELGPFLTLSKLHVENNTFKGLERADFTAVVSGLVHNHNMKVPKSLTALMAAVTKRSIFDGLGFGLKML